MYRERNVRRADLGTGEAPSGYVATPRVTDPISGDPVKWEGTPDWGVGGVHSTEDGEDNTTSPEGRGPALLVRAEKVRVRECQWLTTP